MIKDTTEGGDTQVRNQKLIDAKLPLSWLISTIGGTILALGGFGLSLNGKMNDVLVSNTELKTQLAEMKGQLKERDTKYEGMRDMMFTMQRSMDAHEVRLTAVERATARR